MAAMLPTNETVNITGVKSYFDYVQTVSSGSFFPMILFGLFIIMFMIFKAGTSGGKAFVGSSFIIMVFSIILTALSWLAPMYMYMTIVMTAIGVVWAYADGLTE